MQDYDRPADELDFEELSAVIAGEFDDAEDYIDSLGFDRAESTEYYKGVRPDDVEEGRSRFVSTDVKDAVSFVMPFVRWLGGLNR